jgi:hypothetical protein
MMDSPFLTWLVGWAWTVLSECIKAWCCQRILRHLGLDNPSATVPSTENRPPAASGPMPVSTAQPLIERLYQTVARYRQGDLP